MFDGFSGVASMFGSVLGYMGQQETNEANYNQSVEGRIFNAQEAEKNRSFQERMSNTAYVRAMQDMSAAGLNPMLAYQQGGSSTPGGSQAQGPAPIPMGNKAAAAAQAGMSAAAIANTQAQTRNTDADTELKKALMKDPDAERNAAGDLPTRSFPAATEEARARGLHYEVTKILEQIDLTRKEIELVKERVKNAVEEGHRIRADTDNTKANTVLTRLAAAEARNKEAFQLKYPGYNQDVAPFIKDGGTILNSAGSAVRALTPARGFK